MRVSLFVPCYVDQLFPRVAWATVEVLERQGCRVDVPRDASCCGQVLLNAGDPAGAERLARRFLAAFEDAEHVVAPSASCVATVRRHYRKLLPASEGMHAALERVHELCEFLVDVLGVTAVGGSCRRRVGLHPSCHGLRELRLGAASELGEARRDPARSLLEALDGIEIVAPERADECCGFGGSFSISEAAVSCAMGRDRLRAHQAAGAEVVTATDMSCLAHLDGLIQRDGTPLEVRHVAEILAGDLGA